MVGFETLFKAFSLARVGGKTTSITPTITTSAGAYTSGDVVGGAITLTDVFQNKRNSILKSVTVKDNANQKAALTILFFNAAPSSATTTDNGAFAWGSSLSSCIGKINIAAADYETIDSKAVADVDTFSRVYQALNDNNLSIVIITTGTPTYAANTTTLYITFNFLQD